MLTHILEGIQGMTQKEIKEQEGLIYEGMTKMCLACLGNNEDWGKG